MGSSRKCFFFFFFQTNDREKKIGSLLEYFILIFHKRRMNINTFLLQGLFLFCVLNGKAGYVKSEPYFSVSGE
jgi:hypothetical protein